MIRLPPPALTPRGMLDNARRVSAELDRAQRMQKFTAATKPDPATHDGMTIRIDGEPAWSDGSAWRRFTDNTVIV